MLGGNGECFRTPSTAGPFRICSVAGFQNRRNDMVYCPPIIRQPNLNVEDSTAIVYFGGDVQDFPENMEINRDSRGYMKYNLENSAILLREAFPLSHIIIIRPLRMEYKTFSCYDNFIRGNNAGIPDHTPMNHALHHLEKLLQNLTQRLISIPENEILEQAAKAAAAAALVSSNESTDSTSSSSSSSSSTITTNDSSQEMDIDILQVHENISVDADGVVIFPNITNANSNGGSCDGNNVDATTKADEISAASTSTIDTAIAQTQLNDAQQHLNNVNNSNATAMSAACSEQQKQQLPTNSQQADNQTTIVDKRQANTNPLWWRENLNLDKSKLVLIGFSKGCVVLNQCIYEFHYLKTLTPDDSSMLRLLSRIKEMYWLDGGHGGQKNTYITSRSLLETLTRMGVNVHIHLTPYQIQDERRPWIKKEEKIFTDLLRRLGCHVTRQLHYDSQAANLMTHFEVLQIFCQQIHILNQQPQQNAGENQQQQDQQQGNAQNANNQQQIDLQVQQTDQEQQSQSNNINKQMIENSNEEK